MLARTAATLLFACVAGVPLLVACTAMTDAAAGVGANNAADLATGTGAGGSGSSAQPAGSGDAGTTASPGASTAPQASTTPPAPTVPLPDAKVCGAKPDFESCDACCFGGDEYPAEAAADVPWLKCACDSVKTTCAGNDKCINLYCSPSPSDTTSVDDCPCVQIEACDPIFNDACAADTSCAAADRCSVAANCAELPSAE